MSVLTRRTRRRIPARLSVLTLELLARPIRRQQIFSVDELARDYEQRIAAGNIKTVEVLGQDGARSVRNAGLPQVASLHRVGPDLERPAGCGSPTATREGGPRRMPRR